MLTLGRHWVGPSNRRGRRTRRLRQAFDAPGPRPTHALSPPPARHPSVPLLLSRLSCVGLLFVLACPAAAAAPDLETVRQLNRANRSAEAEAAARALLAEMEPRSGPESVE